MRVGGRGEGKGVEGGGKGRMSDGEEEKEEVDCGHPNDRVSGRVRSNLEWWDAANELRMRDPALYTRHCARIIAHCSLLIGCCVCGVVDTGLPGLIVLD